MTKARLGKELYVEVPIGIGMLAQVTSVVAASGVNIRAICAVEYEEKGHFWMVTDNNLKAGKSIASFALRTEEREAVLVELPDQVGVTANLGKLMDEAEINLSYIYGGVSSQGKVALTVFNSSNNKKAVEILNR